MFDHLQLDRYPVGVAAILFSVVAVLYLQSLIEKLLGPETLRKAHEVGGYFMALVGTFYAVLLGLVVFDAMSKFEDADRTVQSEARAALAVFTLSAQFPAYEPAIRTLVHDYVDDVIHKEWALMGEGRVSKTANEDLVNLLYVVESIEPTTLNQQTVYSTLLAESVSLWNSRLNRNKVSNYGLPQAEWAVLLLGAAITIAFTFFFTTESHGVHLVMRGMVTLLISMTLYLVLLFGAPFSGDLNVSNAPFRFVEGVFDSAYGKHMQLPGN
jgi:Protein of unknown function (DUF4239)